MSTSVTSYEYTYINNVFGRFIAGVADFIRTGMYPRTQDVIISSYSKAVEYIRRRKRDVGENWSPKYPYMIIDPSLDIEPDTPTASPFHGYLNHVNAFAGQQFIPEIYLDDNISITAVLNRYKGTIEVIRWNSSIYDNIDERVFLFQFWGGLNRIISPNIEGIILLPDSIVNMNYDNPYTGETYNLNWEESEQNIGIKLIKNINQNRMCFPFTSAPYLKLTGVSDGSEKYGGSDAIGDHRLSFTIDWECDLPTHLIATINKFPIGCRKIQLDIDVSDYYYVNTAAGGLYYPKDKIVLHAGQDDTSLLDTDLEYQRTFTYTLSSDDVADLEEKRNVIIDTSIYAEYCIQYDMVGKNGSLDRDFQWKMPEGNQLELIGEGLYDYGFESGDNVSIIFYRKALNVKE